MLLFNIKKDFIRDSMKERVTIIERYWIQKWSNIKISDRSDNIKVTIYLKF